MLFRSDAVPPTVREAAAWLRAPGGPPGTGSALPGHLSPGTGTDPSARRPGGSMLGLGQALRRLARDRAVVVVQTASREHHGRIDRVGRDHIDLQPVQSPEWGERRRTTDQRIVIGVESIVLVGASGY